MDHSQLPTNEHHYQPEQMSGEPILTEPTPKLSWKQKFNGYYQQFLALPEWKQMAAVGVAVLLLLAVSGGAWAAASSSQNSEPSEKKVAAASPTPTPTSTPKPVVEETESTPTPSPSNTPTPKPSTTPSPTPKASASPTPTPSSSTKTYVLNWSTGKVTANVGIDYGVYAILKYDGQTVTDQSKVKYTWTIADSSIADVTPVAACTNGINSPCPEDHATLKTKKEGKTTVTAKATWKDTGAFIDDVTIELEVKGSATPTASPTPTPTSPPEMSISYPTTGQAIAKIDSGTLCMVDVPVRNTQGLQRKHNLNSQGWTSYQDHFTLCYQPPVGANSIQVQYKNSAGLESVVYNIQFTYGP